MTYQSLYRKYRPSEFNDVIGQETIVTALSNAVLKNKISHAYLFTGPRGTGKTTTAKLLAKAINCESQDELICGVCDNCLQAAENSHPDIVEIDAASNNGVEEIRNLIERVKFMPIVGKYKVYIIDEVHMLSLGAFNALLKTLEEPPEHVVFILATTEIHKVLPTIISRCQRYDFTRISNKQIAERLEYIVNNEHRTIEAKAPELIASLSGGGMRNALTILEQAMIFNDGLITSDSIYENNGMLIPQEKIKLFQDFKNNDLKELLSSIEIVNEKTVDVARFVMGLIASLKDGLVYKYTNDINFVDANDIDFIRYIKENYSNEEIVSMINLLLDYHEKIRFSSTPFVHLEVAFIEIYENTTKDESIPKTVEKTSEKEIIKQEPVAEKLIEDAVLIGEGTLEVLVEVEDEIIEDDFLDEELHDDTILIVETEKDVPIKLEEEKPVIRDVEKEVTDQHQVDLFANTEEVVPMPKLDLDTDEIVQYMVSADKDIRLQDQASYQECNKYLSNPKWAKESKLLNNTAVAMSGESFIVVVTKNKAQSRNILDDINMHGLISFMEEVLGKPKQVFAITETQFKVAVEKFKDLSSKGELPAPLSKEDFITGQDDYVDETEEALLNLFGERLEIKE